MITSMRRCVACDDLWSWPTSSRSFDLDLENRVRSVASTVPDRFFRYLVQMITSLRRCVACVDLWPWLTSSRSFDLDLENRVRSVASTVLDGFFPYLVQMIISMRMCVTCDDLWRWPISSRSFDLVLTLDPAWLNSVDNHEAAGVSSESRRSSCSSFFNRWVEPLSTQYWHWSTLFFSAKRDLNLHYYQFLALPNHHQVKQKCSDMIRTQHIPLSGPPFTNMV